MRAGAREGAIERVAIQSTETKARKFRAFFSEQRQNMQLLHRAGHSETTQDALKQELLHILDSLIINYPHTLTKLGVKQKQTFEERKTALGIEKRLQFFTFEENKFMQSAQYKADYARKRNWQWRVAQEHEEKTRLGWYPFFITLTVDPKLGDAREIWQNGKELRLYIRRLCKVVTDTLGHPEARKKTKIWDYRPESDYITYIGVIEHGKSREHHHGHFLVWFRDIPNHWKQCPNKNVRITQHRTHNECKGLRAYWPYSQNQAKALYFRSIGDVWEKHSFAVPLKDGKPMKIAPATYAGFYISKYMSKEHKEWKHRVKATRSLGLKKLQKTIKRLPPNLLEAITWKPKNSELNHSLSQIHTVPLALLRREAKWIHFLHLFTSKQLDTIDCLTSNSGIFQKMLRSVRSGARPDRMPSQEFYDWVEKHLTETRGYSEDLIIEAHDQLASIFLVEKKSFEHIKIGANNIGNS